MRAQYNPEGRKMVTKGAYFCIGLGAIFLLLAVYLGMKKMIFLKNSAVTTGSIVNVNVTKTYPKNKKTGFSSSSGTRHYTPEISFSAPGGEQITFLSDTTTTNKDKYQTGRSVEVRYDTRDPRRASINSFSEIWTGIIALAVFGLVLLSLGLPLLRAIKKTPLP